MKRLSAIAALALAATAQAADRPFVATSSAAGEEDDDNVWAVETWLQKTGATRGFSIAPEYAFDPRNSVQFEFGFARDRSLGQRSTSFEVEYKHLFNSIARDGYGIGIALSAGLARESGAGWKSDGVALHLPFTWQLGSDSGALLHLNAGVDKPRDGRREWFRAAAIEWPLFKRFTAIAEVARSGEASVAQIGVRHWIKREKFALDVGVLRTRENGGSKENGWVVGLSWFDL